MQPGAIREIYEETAFFANFRLLNQLYTDITEQQYQQRIKEMLPLGYRQVVIEKEGQIVALCGFHRASHLSSGPYLYVDDLVTEENARGKAYGKGLLAWLLEEARRLGCGYIFLDAFVENKPAHRLYLREGFDIAAFHFIKKLSL